MVTFGRFGGDITFSGYEPALVVAIAWLLALKSTNSGNHERTLNCILILFITPKAAEKAPSKRLELRPSAAWSDAAKGSHNSFFRFVPLSQNDTVYKCRVYDDREIVVNGGTRQLVSEIEIPVYVAEKFSDTCGEAAADGIEWPRTKKVFLLTYSHVQWGSYTTR